MKTRILGIFLLLTSWGITAETFEECMNQVQQLRAIGYDEKSVQILERTCKSNEIDRQIARNNLTIYITPASARATITLPDIKPKYYPNIRLPAKKHRVIVKAKDYATEEFTVDLSNDSVVKTVSLTKLSDEVLRARYEKRIAKEKRQKEKADQAWGSYFENVRRVREQQERTNQ